MTYTLPDIPYNFSDFGPAMSEEALCTHYEEYHKNYTTKLNTICEEQKRDTNRDIRELVKELDAESTPMLRNNAGGYLNHLMFFQNLTPGGKPISERFAKVIIDEAGTEQNLIDSLVSLGMSRFGAGWAWLVVRENGEIMGITTENEDNPLMPAITEYEATTYQPILAIDLWEHAYFIDYKHRKKDYLAAVIANIDWSVVEDRYFAALEEMGIECPYDI